jgi:hypothetical protein
MRIKTKKIIAREILLFFGSVILTSFFFLCLVAWDYFLDKSINKLTESKNETLRRIEQLPPDRLKDLYDGGLKDIMIINYQVGDDKYAIPKNLEEEFLIDIPNAIKIGAYSKGYSYIKVQKISIKTPKKRSVSPSPDEYFDPIENVRDHQENEVITFRDNNELGIKIKEIYPVYDDIPNQELAAKLLKKYPAYVDSMVVYDNRIYICWVFL